MPLYGLYFWVLIALLSNFNLKVVGLTESEEQAVQINPKGVKGAPPDSLISRFCLHALRFGTCNIRGTEKFDTAFYLFLICFSTAH